MVILVMPGEVPATTTGVELAPGIGPVVYHPITENPSDAVSSARRVHGAAPLGYAARDEIDALAALAAGADEALKVLPSDREGLMVLARRARLRGDARLRQERAQVNHAHAERLAALGTVVAGVAHEINNPSAAVMLSLEVLQLMLAPMATVIDELGRMAAAGRGATPAEIARMAVNAHSGGPPSEALEVLREIGVAMSTISDVVKDLRVFSRSADSEPAQLIDVHALLDQVLRIVGKELLLHATIERDYAVGLPPVLAPRSRLAQVFTNVLINAGQAVREIQRPVHRVRISTRTSDEAVVVSISDTGPGIPTDALERIFEPFYTTKPAGVGTGLGLSTSREIIRRLGGELLAESKPGEGATFVVFIPRAGPEAIRSARVVREVPALSAARRAAVLVVDDDERVLRALARVLRERYDVLLAVDGTEAIDLLRSGSHADAIVCDVSMPEVDGRALYEWLLAERPDLAARTLFVTAGARSPEDDTFLRKSNRPVLDKPVSREALLRALGEMLESHREGR